MPLARIAPRQHAARIASLRLMQSREIALERQLARAIVGIGRNAMSRYVGGGDPTRVDMSTIRRVLTPSIRETARTFGQLVGEKSTMFISGRSNEGAKMNMGLEAKLFDDLDAETEAFIAQYTAGRVTQISDALRAQIVEIVRRGLAEGQSTEEVARAIVDATSGEMAMARARRIARTETHTASMVGQFGAARASPLQYRKEWLATEDHRTRESHAEANGQQRDLDEPFDVGGEELMFPGDPNGSPGNVINCRCTILLEPVAIERPEVEPIAPPEPPEVPPDLPDRVHPIPVPEPPDVPPEPPEPPDEAEARDIDAGELIDDVEAWRNFYAMLRNRHTLPANVTLYAAGEDCGLPQYASEEDLAEWVGEELKVPRYASLNPIRVGTEHAGLGDSFPLYGRPVVVEIAAPAGAPVEGGLEVAMGIELAPTVKIVVTAVREERWRETQEDAGVPIDPAPRRYDFRRLPPGRGVTVVEAEVQRQ
jgi:hypothetical protein